MWIFYKVMYPRPPKSMMPQEGDITEPRNCNFCGHSLAEYRGVLETPPVNLDTSNIVDDIDATTKASVIKANNELFFCNYEHQADFHAGKTYSSRN
ncbi:hypothetical protein ES754_09825 [Psychrobacter frigidicola]|uniref:Uncharacterized protein n=2 Tax=Psychrobacter frigidicola TaxID=45611 RepID=A0A5C7A1W0_9GAMM|nr:hypothetical protein ES754_09825 [Psychrobacter frigidicola]